MRVRRPTTYTADSTAEELDLEFYRTYDPYLLYSRASSLLMAMDQPGTERRRLSKLPVERQIKQHLAALAADIYFTEMQQFEASFALFVADFAHTPACAYLADYENRDLRALVKSFIGGKGLGETYISERSERSLVQRGIYRDSIPQDNESASKWNENIDNIIWLIRRVGERFIESSEYNSYKHGLRVATGASYVTFAIDGRATAIRHASEHAVSHLQAVSTGPGTKKLRHETVHFSPIESWHHIAYLAGLAATMRSVRLAALDQTVNPPLIEMFLTLDRRALDRMGKRERFTFDV